MQLEGFGRPIEGVFQDGADIDGELDVLLDGFDPFFGAGPEEPQTAVNGRTVLLADEQGGAVKVETEPVGVLIPTAGQGAGEQDLAVTAAGGQGGGAAGFSG